MLVRELRGTDRPWAAALVARHFGSSEFECLIERDPAD
jgi:hypothetical protein